MVVVIFIANEQSWFYVVKNPDDSTPRRLSAALIHHQMLTTPYDAQVTESVKKPNHRVYQPRLDAFVCENARLLQHF